MSVICQQLIEFQMFLQEKTAQARQIYSERIEVSRTVKSLDAEMNRLRERIKTEKSHRGNTEEIIQ